MMFTVWYWFVNYVRRISYIIAKYILLYGRLTHSYFGKKIFNFVSEFQPLQWNLDNIDLGVLTTVKHWYMIQVKVHTIKCI